MTAGRNETILASLSQFSTSLNYEWRTTSAVIPILTPTEISVSQLTSVLMFILIVVIF